MAGLDAVALGAVCRSAAAAATPDKSSGAEREVGGAGSEDGGGWVVDGEGVPPEVRVEGPPSSSVSMLLSAKQIMDSFTQGSDTNFNKA